MTALARCLRGSSGRASQSCIPRAVEQCRWEEESVRMTKRWGYVLCLLVSLQIVAGCTRAPMLKYDSGAPAQTMSVLDARPVMDGRPRFREIFCDVLAQQPDRARRSCDELLHRMVDEPGATETRSMAVHQPGLRVLFVPGLFSDCTRAFAVPFDSNASSSPPLCTPRRDASRSRTRVMPVSARMSARSARVTT